MKKWVMIAIDSAASAAAIVPGPIFVFVRDICWGTTGLSLFGWNYQVPATVIVINQSRNNFI